MKGICPTCGHDRDLGLASEPAALCVDCRVAYELRTKTEEHAGQLRRLMQSHATELHTERTRATKAEYKLAEVAHAFRRATSATNALAELLASVAAAIAGEDPGLD